MEDKAYLTTDEAFSLIFDAGVLQNKQTLLRFVREGRINADMNYKRKGYRFKKDDVLDFIDKNKENEKENPLKELERLRAENKELRFQLKTPESVVRAENALLAKRIKEHEQTIQRLNEEIQKVKDDNTIRIRVE